MTSFILDEKAPRTEGRPGRLPGGELCFLPRRGGEPPSLPLTPEKACADLHGGGK